MTAGRPFVSAAVGESAGVGPVGGGDGGAAGLRPHAYPARLTPAGAPREDPAAQDKPDALVVREGVRSLARAVNSLRSDKL